MFCKNCNDTGYVNNEPCPDCSSPEKQAEIEKELEKIRLWRRLHIVEEPNNYDGTDITPT